MTGLLLRNCFHVQPSAEGEGAHGVDILVQGDSIAAIGPRLAAVNGAREIDCSHHVVVPGFVNTHHHFFQTLTWIRRFGRPSPPGILNAPGRRPILETFTAGAFQLLAEDPGREIVFGRAGDAHGQRKAAEESKTLQQAPLIKIAMNFRIQEVDATHCTLTTETRVYAAGPQVVHGFAAYWRMIYPGSSLLRYEWLRAIKRRAEVAPDANPTSDVGQPVIPAI